MPDEIEKQDTSAVIVMLGNISRDVGQVKTDLAVNTTKTSYIEEHLRTLNGKVAKQEDRLQNVEGNNKELVKSKARIDAGWVILLRNVLIFGFGLLSAYIIKTFF